MWFFQCSPRPSIGKRKGLHRHGMSFSPSALGLPVVVLQRRELPLRKFILLSHASLHAKVWSIFTTLIAKDWLEAQDVNPFWILVINKTPKVEVLWLRGPWIALYLLKSQLLMHFRNNGNDRGIYLQPQPALNFWSGWSLVWCDLDEREWPSFWLPATGSHLPLPG